VVIQWRRACQPRLGPSDFDRIISPLHADCDAHRTRNALYRTSLTTPLMLQLFIDIQAVGVALLHLDDIGLLHLLT